MGYCPFPTLGLDTAGGVATGRAERRAAHMHARQRQRVRDMALGARQELIDFMSRPHPLCRDMVLRLQWAAGSWQKCCVTTEFPGKLEGLGRDRDMLAPML